MTAEKIMTVHLNRPAYVYLRQSTMAQVREHRESSQRQYALRERAIQLGWPAEEVRVIDGDLGRSGQTSGERAGFQRLAEEVARGRVGAIFALEISRLARSSADWHRLLELCTLADVALGDEQTIYRPHSDYNDRLLLGFKGQMSEAEAYWMHLRLDGAKLAKARRGELVFLLPAGLAWSSGKLVLDPDEGVRKAVSSVFERFRLDRTARRVARYLQQHGLGLPRGRDDRGHVIWEPARYRRVQAILKNPLYAGAYVFGRTRHRKGLVDGQVRRRVNTTLPVEEWPILLRDHHPGYISWEEYMANQRRIAENRPDGLRSPARRGAAREGAALLQGLALCGRCGRRMRTRYVGSTARPSYVCDGSDDGGTEFGSCWSVAAKMIDQAVEDLFLQAVTPPEVELSLAVAAETERQAAEVEKQWQMRLDQARYEARQAERQYHAVDPDNRLVARTLESNWEEKLRVVAELEREHQEVRRREQLELTDADRAAIRELARDLPAVWRAPTTTFADRKNLLRMVIREVALAPIDVPTRATHVRVLWQTDHVTEMQIRRPHPGGHDGTPAEAVDMIRNLAAANMTDAGIAAELARRGLRTATGATWSPRAVLKARFRWGVPKRQRHRPEDSAGSTGLAAHDTLCGPSQTPEADARS